MATLTAQQINAAFSDAFGRNATKAELSYWGTKQDTQLRDALRADTKAGGTYASYRTQLQQINAAFSDAFGRNATQQELDYWLPKSSEQLRDALRADTRTGGTYADYRTQQAQQASNTQIIDVGGGGGGASNTTSSDVGGGGTTIPTPTPKPLTYEEWLAGPGQQYANRYDPVNLEKEYGPYYAQLLGGVQNEKTKATDIYNTNVDRTTTNVGESSNEAGLYGSGIYQKELGQALGDLSKSYENTWGTGQYTPYSLRLSEIEQQKKEAIANAELQRKGQAFDVYSTQYYPLFNQ